MACLTEPGGTHSIANTCQAHVKGEAPSPAGSTEAWSIEEVASPKEALEEASRAAVEAGQRSRSPTASYRLGETEVASPKEAVEEASRPAAEAGRRSRAATESRSRANTEAAAVEEVSRLAAEAGPFSRQLTESADEEEEDDYGRNKTMLILPREVFGRRKTVEVTVGKVTDCPEYFLVPDDKKLGEGLFGTVRLAVRVHRAAKARGRRLSDARPMEERAVKTVNINAARRIGVRQATLNQELLIHREASEAQRDLSELQPAVLTQRHQPLVVQLHELFVDKMEVSFVMERCGCTAAEYMESLNDNRSQLCLVKARRWAGELASALHFLHNKQMIAHRDVKSDNILLDRRVDPEHIRLADFGFATPCKDASSLCNKTFCGTPEFIPPELLQKNAKAVGYNGQMADMWSAGVVTLELYGVYNPFGDRSGGKRDVEWTMPAVRNICNKDFVPPMPELKGLTPADTNFIQGLLRRSVAERLTAAAAVQHPLFHQDQASCNCEFNN